MAEVKFWSLPNWLLDMWAETLEPQGRAPSSWLVGKRYRELRWRSPRLLELRGAAWQARGQALLPYQLEGIQRGAAMGQVRRQENGELSFPRIR